MASIAKNLMSSVTRQVARNVRQLSTSRHMMDTYQVQTEKEFPDKVMNGGKPAVTFCATWCHLCKEVQPGLEAAIKRAEDKVNLAKVEIVKNGQIVDRWIHLQDNEMLASFIKKLRD